MNVSLATVIHEPNWTITGRILRQSLAALEDCQLSGELLILDNSTAQTAAAQQLADGEPRVRYFWNEGYNIYIYI